MSVLQEPCLVLNRNWAPITFLPVQTSIVTVMRDMASVLDVQDYLLLSFEDWVDLGRDTGRWIQTPNTRIAAPDVVLLKKYGERPPRRVVFNRPNLIRRDEYVCQYCGVDLTEVRATIEHVIPRSRGGETGWFNCVAACDDCNSRKDNRTPKEAGMPLRKKPTKPFWKPTLALPRSSASIRASWAPFLAKDQV